MEAPESAVVDAAYNGTHYAIMETAHSFKSSTHEQTSPSSAHPLAPQNSVSKAREQQQWIWGCVLRAFVQYLHQAPTMIVNLKRGRLEAPVALERLGGLIRAKSTLSVICFLFSSWQSPKDGLLKLSHHMNKNSFEI
ncbi:hypothetical protein Hamer_G002573, partial [Homarus americanus]